MSQNVPVEAMPDPAPRPTMRPTARTGTGVVPTVGTSTGYTTYLSQGGYPDTAESGLAFAAGQRAAARQQESRAGITSGPAAADELIAPPGTGPAQPIQTVGPQPYNRR